MKFKDFPSNISICAMVLVLSIDVRQVLCEGRLFYSIIYMFIQELMISKYVYDGAKKCNQQCALHHTV